MTDRTAQSGFETATEAEEEHVSPLLPCIVDSIDEGEGEVSFAPPLQSGEGEVMGPAIIALPENASRGEMVALLSKDIPHNQYGLPQYFLRTDLLDLSQGYVSQEALDIASVPLSYYEGYPTLEDGTLFWSRLPHEPDPAYFLFQRYADQAEELGIRQLEALSLQEGVELSLLRQHYQEFMWSARARAYDLFIVAAETRKRQFRTRRMESNHFDQAEKMIAKLFQEKFDNEDWWEELNAKEAIEAMVELAKLQRLSVGLTGMNASSLPKNPLPDGASAEMIMEHLTRGTSRATQSQEGFAARLQAFLEDPGQGMQLQDAIIRISRSDTLTDTSGAYQGE